MKMIVMAISIMVSSIGYTEESIPLIIENADGTISIVDRNVAIIEYCNVRENFARMVMEDRQKNVSMNATLDGVREIIEKANSAGVDTEFLKERLASMKKVVYAAWKEPYWSDLSQKTKSIDAFAHKYLNECHAQYN